MRYVRRADVPGAPLPGGHAEILAIYGQVDDIRPEDMESER